MVKGEVDGFDTFGETLATLGRMRIPCMVLVVLPVVAIRKISSLWPLSLLGALAMELGAFRGCARQIGQIG